MSCTSTFSIYGMLRFKKSGQKPLSRKTTVWHWRGARAVARSNLAATHDNRSASYGKLAFYQQLGSNDGCLDSSLVSVSSSTNNELLAPWSTDVSSQRCLFATPIRSDESRDDQNTPPSCNNHETDSLVQFDPRRHDKSKRVIYGTVRSLLPGPFRPAAASIVRGDDVSNSPNGCGSYYGEFDVTETFSSPPIPTKTTTLEDLKSVQQDQTHFRCRADDESAATPQSRPSDEIAPPPAATGFTTTTHLGFKITVVSEQLKIYVVNLLSPRGCECIRRAMQKHVNHLQAMGHSDMGFRAIYTYSKMDIPCCEITEIVPFMSLVGTTINQILAHVLDDPKAITLAPRDWKEPHMLLYDFDNEHTGIKMHHDGSDWTWNMMLSHNDEYKGGGTYIRALRKTIVLRQGQVLIHPGNLFHKGVDITSGTRLLVVSFMDGLPANVDDAWFDQTEDGLYETDVVCL
ncbi:hypothetical protein MPSEU_000251600 [Mayamaea pseudoterrestris]|nr:hypothetical protein MPSEU_000251600 [Mayamaea pseudoterrestris]